MEQLSLQQLQILLFPVSRFDLPYHNMNSFSKVHFTLYVLTVGFIFIGEIELCQLRFKTFRD